MLSETFSRKIDPFLRNIANLWSFRNKSGLRTTTRRALSGGSPARWPFPSTSSSSTSLCSSLRRVCSFTASSSSTPPSEILSFPSPAPLPKSESSPTNGPLPMFPWVLPVGSEDLKAATGPTVSCCTLSSTCSFASQSPLASATGSWFDLLLSKDPVSLCASASG